MLPVCLYSLDIHCYISITQLLIVLGFSPFFLSMSINKTKKEIVHQQAVSYLSFFFLVTIEKQQQQHL
jgi:hypothetical protein